MANGINIQGPQPIVLEDPGSLFKGLTGTILKGVVSDLFYQARQDRRNQQASLWEGYKLEGEMAVKLADVDQIDDAIAKIDLKTSDARTDNVTKSQLSTLRQNLELHKGALIKDAPRKEIFDVTEGFAQTFAEAKGGGSPEFLKDVISDFRSEEQRLIDKHVSERMGDVGEVTKSLESLIENEHAAFAEKYYQEGTTEIKEDLTTEELNQLIIDQELISNKSQMLQEEKELVVGRMEELDPVAYLREIKGDKEAAVSLDILSNQIRILEEEKNKSESIRNWNISINEYAKVLKDGKKNPEHFGALSAALLDDLTEIAQTNAYYLQKTHFDMLDDLHLDAQVINSALNVIDRVEYIQEHGGYKSDTARDHLQQAFAEATRAYTVEDKSAISKAITSLNSAITSEGSYNRGVAQGIKNAKKFESKEKRALLQNEASRVAESFGKGPKGSDTKKSIDSDYLGAGKYSINQNPEGIFQGFNIDTPQNLDAYKVGVGENVAKLVISSDLEGIEDTDKARELANQALNVNLSNSARARALDELYNSHLVDGGVDLDFIGWGQEDTTAKNLYSKYRSMYETLYNVGVESAAKWGEDYSSQFISEYGHGSAIDTLTGEDLSRLFDDKP
jgi:hypothetical protein